MAIGDRRYLRQDSRSQFATEPILLRTYETHPQRELRNRIGPVLREVEQGRQMRIAADGRPVADLVPIAGIRGTYVARAESENLPARASLDCNFARDLKAAAGGMIDEL